MDAKDTKKRSRSKRREGAQRRVEKRGAPVGGSFSFIASLSLSTHTTMPPPRRARTSAKKVGSATKKKAAAAAAPDAMDADAPATPAVWRPGLDALAEGEALDYDPTAYDCLHTFGLEWPCLR